MQFGQPEQPLPYPTPAKTRRGRWPAWAWVLEGLGLLNKRALLTLSWGAHGLTALVLCLFAWFGLSDAIQYGEPVVQVLIAILAAVVLVVISSGIAQKRYRLEAIATAIGLLIMVSNHFLKLFYGYDIFEGHWFLTPDWVKYATYSLLAFSVARRKHWALAVTAPALAALIDLILGGIAVLPTQGELFGWGFALTRFWEGLSFFSWRVVVIAVLCGITGTIVAQAWRIILKTLRHTVVDHTRNAQNTLYS